MARNLTIEPGKTYVHCEMCGHLWATQDWNPSVPCPNEPHIAKVVAA